MIDRGGDGAPRDRLSGGDRTPGESDAVCTAFVGRRAVRAVEAGVLRPLQTVLWSIRSDEPDEIAGDRTARVDASRMRLGVDARNPQVADLTHLLEGHLFGDVLEVGCRVARECLEHVVLRLASDLRNLRCGFGKGDLDLVVTAPPGE